MLTERKAERAGRVMMYTPRIRKEGLGMNSLMAVFQFLYSTQRAPQAEHVHPDVTVKKSMTALEASGTDPVWTQFPVVVS